MFKNISLYISLILTIAVSCSFITYCLFYNPFSFSEPLLLWIIRLITYLLFGWWLKQLADKAGIEDLNLLPIIIPTISILSNSKDFRTLDTLLHNFQYQKIMCYACFLVIAIWILHILISKGKTLFGFLIILNSIVTIFILFPFGIPRIDISFSGGQSVVFTCFPFYTLNNYQPFTQKDSGWITFLLDIRTISITIFISYEIFRSAIQTTKIKYVDNLENRIEATENSIQQFFAAGLYFIWNIIRRFLFFTKSFCFIFKNNILVQVKKSIISYIYVLLIILAFSSSFLIFHLSEMIYNYNKTSSIILLSSDQIGIAFVFIYIFIFPLFLAKLIKAEVEPFKLFSFNSKERPTLFLPIYISLLGIGLASIVSCFVEGSYGLYLIIFVGVIIYSGIWGYMNYKKPQEK